MAAADALTKNVSPLLTEAPYARGQAGGVGLLLVLMAQESERTVDTLVNEQDAMRALFEDAARAPLPERLRTRLAAAAMGARTSLRVSDLEHDTAALNDLLIELHEAVEESPFDWAARLEARIWEILKLGAACRALYLPTL